MNKLFFILSFFIIMSSCQNGKKEELTITQKQTTNDVDTILPNMIENKKENIKIKISSVDSIWIETKGNKKYISTEEASNYNLENPEISFFTFEYNSDNIIPQKRLSCKSPDEFHSLVEKPFVYDSTSYKCDVNKDGLEDYLILIKDERDAINSDGHFDNYYNRGLMLVLNRGDHFETDVRNNMCIISTKEEFEEYEEYQIVASKDKLEIRTQRPTHSSKQYTFIYRNNDYVLTNIWKDDVTNFTITEICTNIDFDKKEMKIKKLVSDEYDANTEYENLEYITAKYKIETDEDIIFSKLGNVLY